MGDILCLVVPGYSFPVLGGSREVRIKGLTKICCSNKCTGCGRIQKEEGD